MHPKPPNPHTSHTQCRFLRRISAFTDRQSALQMWKSNVIWKRLSILQAAPHHVTPIVFGFPIHAGFCRGVVRFTWRGVVVNNVNSYSLATPQSFSVASSTDNIDFSLLGVVQYL
ncbi:hypothetical protein AVEN_208970-1 [Araneus ventricosus]|uniref:Uncharacterized protein n=1 Tax=Araneus ventricosus TaxID=182803 RepID=A0A4Y2CPB7_ARAVE|nr:hypothetical protein AVEN_208970-1 [Araneus ventricosus]